MDKPQILLVEDDLDLSEMVSTYFRVQNYEVLTAAWGEEALTIADQTPLDLVMLDVRLPDMDGFEICRRLLSKRKTKDIPIIFLTEKRERVDKLQGLELGVVDYITKPFDIQELRLRVRNIIKRSNEPSVVNPVTDLPEGDTVIDRLEKLTKTTSAPPWVLLKLSIEQLDAFRERYGFVAADDVLRAIALMIRNAVKEFGKEDDFIGHLDTHSFIIITDETHVDAIRDRIERRIEQSRTYFYPLRDRDGKRPTDKDYIKLSSLLVKSSLNSKTLEGIRQALDNETPSATS